MKLIDISGAKESFPLPYEPDNDQGVLSEDEQGFNAAIDALEQIKVRVDIDKLAAILRDYRGGHSGFPPTEWDYREAEAIEATLNSWLYLKKG